MFLVSNVHAHDIIVKCKTIFHVLRNITWVLVPLLRFCSRYFDDDVVICDDEFVFVFGLFIYLFITY